jgi:hypothetical protein
VETLALPVGTFHGIGFLEIHPLGHPAFCAIGKRGGFYKFPTHPEFPAVDTEPAVLKRLLLFGKALNPAAGCLQNAIVVVGHDKANPRVIQYVHDEHKKEIFLSATVFSAVFISGTILKTI